MKILATNDDGIHSEGLHALISVLVKRGDEVTVVAPASEQSAISRALTMHRILRARPGTVPGFEGLSFIVDGTPSDCVKLGVLELLDERPDMVVSGINIGANIGGDVLYSGTVAAAMEAAYQGIPALALSTSYAKTKNEKTGFGPAGEVFNRAMALLDEHPLPTGTILNVNFPQGNMAGYRIAPLGKLNYQEHYSKRTDPRGGEYYWLDGSPRGDTRGVKTDVYWFRQGYCTMTPLQLDITNHEFLHELICK